MTTAVFLFRIVINLLHVIHIYFLKNNLQAAIYVFICGYLYVSLVFSLHIRYSDTWDSIHSLSEI
jgi:hypothetical protein